MYVYVHARSKWRFLEGKRHKERDRRVLVGISRVLKNLWLKRERAEKLKGRLALSLPSCTFFLLILELARAPATRLLLPTYFMDNDSFHRTRDAMPDWDRPIIRPLCDYARLFCPS